MNPMFHDQENAVSIAVYAMLCLTMPCCTCLFAGKYKTLYPVIAIRKALIYHKKNLQGIKTWANFKHRMSSLIPPHNPQISSSFSRHYFHRSHGFLNSSDWSTGYGVVVIGVASSSSSCALSHALDPSTSGPSFSTFFTFPS